MKNKFAAFVVGRRSIAAAVFNGQKLDFWEVRSFHAREEQAISAVTGFVNYIIERCGIEAAGLQETPEGLEARMAALTRVAHKLLHEHGIPILTTSEENLFRSYAHPPVFSRALLREIALQIFPQLRNYAFGKELLDASVLGLYFQTERLLSDY